MRTLQNSPDFAAEIVSRFEAINWPYLPSMKLGFKANPNYDLEFAYGKLIDAERHYAASQGERVTVTDDRALRDREGYLHWMAETAGIHRNWPQHLLKPHELDAWIEHYEGGIRECNQAGYYLSEVMKGANYDLKVPQHLRDKYSVHSDFYCLVDAAMLCKIRWYRASQSRFHKPDRYEYYNHEFIQRVLKTNSQ